MTKLHGTIALAILSVVTGMSGAGWAASSATLDTLDSGVGSISAGNATYSDFGYGGTTLDSTVIATASTNANGSSVITFTRTGAAGPWTQLDGNSVITFHVDFTTPVTMTTLDMAGTVNGLAVSSVGETDHVGSVPYSLQVDIDGIDSTQSLTDTDSFVGSVTSVDVVKSIDIASAGGTATITSVDNVFGTVPEPASMGLMGLGILGLLHRRRRVNA